MIQVPQAQQGQRVQQARINPTVCLKSMIRMAARGLALGCLLLCSCSTDMRAGLLSIQQDIMPSSQVARHTQLKPDLRYLLVQSDGREALMVWVGTERSLLCEATVWVSADGVVIRLCHGRLVGVSEPQRQWHLVDESSPLNIMPVLPNRTIHQQTTDQQPGFHFGNVLTVEKIQLTSLDRPIPGINMHPKMQWVEERDHLSGVRLALYTVSSEHDGMAGQRCITPDWCLQWQTWPIKFPASNS